MSVCCLGKPIDRFQCLHSWQGEVPKRLRAISAKGGAACSTRHTSGWRQSALWATIGVAVAKKGDMQAGHIPNYLHHKQQGGVLVSLCCK